MGLANEMTSRRSRPTDAQRKSRALQFVPGHVGGRVASAQPVRRLGGTLRNPSIGTTAPPPAPAIPTFAAWNTTQGFSGTPSTPYIDLEEWTYKVNNGPHTNNGDDHTYDTVTLADGDRLILAIAADPVGWVFNPPTGWTTLGSGSMTNLDWWVATTIYESGVTDMQPTAPSFRGDDPWTWPTFPDTTEGFQMRVAVYRGGSATPSIWTDEVLASTSATVPTPPAGWVNPYQLVFGAPNLQAYGHSPAPIDDDAWYHCIYSQNEGTLGYITDGARNCVLSGVGLVDIEAPDSNDWVRIVVGWE